MEYKSKNDNSNSILTYNGQCLHKYKDASINALTLNDDGTYTCTICHNTFSLAEIIAFIANTAKQIENETSNKRKEENIMIKELILKLHEIFTIIKDFNSGYSSDCLNDGKMIVEYKGDRYILEIRKVEHHSEDIMEDVRRLRYL